MLALARRLAGPLAAAASFVFFAARLLRFVDRYAVNILFWDQFDYLVPLREHASAWQLFSWTHGPHRMGLGYFFIAAAYGLSGWDERVESFATAGLMMLICALALLLKRRISGRLSPLDACIPALVLTTAQFEIFIGTPNAAHGPIPLLLVVLAPFLWLLRSGPLRALLGGALAFCAAYTGFALFLVPVLAALFLLDLRESRWNALGAALSLAGLGAFFAGYHFHTAAECFQFPAEKPVEYLPFVGLMLMRAMRLTHLVRIAAPLAWLALASLIAVAVAGALRLVREPSLASRTIALFAGFTLLFVAQAAVGRVCYGLGAALGPRYVPYVIPGWLAAYLLLSGRSRWCAGALVAVVLAVQIFVHDDLRTIEWYAGGKARWRECFLATSDERGCNQSTSFRIYPAEGAPQVAQMFEFLKANRLNLYRR